MKKILFLAVLFLMTLGVTDKLQAQETEINWMSLTEAVAAQQKNPKKIFMDAYTKWCGPCKLLDKNTFHDPKVVQYVNEHYYAVKFDAEGNEKITFKGKTYSNPNWDASRGNGRNASHELSRYFRINSYPTMLFLDEEGNFLTAVKGYRMPKQLELYLKLFGSNDYKNIKTKEAWEAYQKDFKYEFE